jgi:hypothetical protein
MVGYTAMTEYQFRLSLPRGFSTVQFLELPTQGLIALNYFPSFVIPLLLWMLIFATVRAVIDLHPRSYEIVTVHHNLAWIVVFACFEALEHSIRDADSLFRRWLPFFQACLIIYAYYLGGIFGGSAGDKIALNVRNGQAIDSLPARKIAQHVHVFLKGPVTHPEQERELPGALTQIWQTDRRFYFIPANPRVCSTPSPSLATPQPRQQKIVHKAVKRTTVEWTSYAEADVSRITYSRAECSDFITTEVEYPNDYWANSLQNFVLRTLAIVSLFILGQCFLSEYDVRTRASVDFSSLASDDFGRLELPERNAFVVQRALMANRDVLIYDIGKEDIYRYYIKGSLSKGFIRRKKTAH